MILLPSSQIHNGFISAINHTNTSTNLLINRIKLGQNHRINAPRLATPDGMLPHLGIELGELVNRIVANQRLPDEHELVRVVDVDQLGERGHERDVVLHAAGCVDQHHVDLVALRHVDRLLAHVARFLALALVEGSHFQHFRVFFDLLYGASSESVASCDHDRQASLDFESVCNFRHVG